MRFLLRTILLLTVLQTGPVLAFDPSAVNRLKSKPVCPGCDLSGAVMTNAYLPGAILKEANLADSNLKGAELSFADLSNAKLAGADLSGTKLINTNLSGSDLTGADISGAGLHGANLSGADLTRADFSGAVLGYVKFQGATDSIADLHLNVSIRSFRAETLSQFVSCVLENDPGAAARLYKEIAGRYPIALTRDLSAARGWVRAQARGSERYGLLASSGARRLRPEGIEVRQKVDPAAWFLNDRSDVRSSYYCEETATEFDVQGLELDWAAIGWDADLR